MVNNKYGINYLKLNSSLMHETDIIINKDTGFKILDLSTHM